MEQQIAETVYRHSLPIQLRFNDVDRFGHINNNAYFAYYDLGKQEYLSAVLGAEVFRSEVVPVVVHIEADFMQPVFYGDVIAVETRVSHLGDKSFALEQRAVRQKDGAVCCRCQTVMVCFSLKAKQSVPIPDDYREAIERFEQIETS